MGQESITHNFCKVHQSTDLQDIIGTAREAAISLLSSLWMETLPSLGNNLSRKRQAQLSPRSKQWGPKDIWKHDL